jgi:hypothetical protein
MRGPSARVRRNAVDIYQALDTPVAGSSGGPVYFYAATPNFPGVRCTAQAIGLREGVDEQNRVTVFVDWLLMFSRDQQVDARDMIIFVDQYNVSHTMFVETERDNASRGGAFTVRALEKV